jgi:Domain of unknown function (DUF1707)
MASHRASDAEREAVAERLRQAAAEGRLSAEELADRVEKAYRAQTIAELETLTADLPPLPVPAPARPPVWQNEDVRRRFAGFLTPNLICIAIWAASGAGYFWPMWVLLFTGIGLVVSVVHALLGIDEHEERREALPPPGPPGT